MTTNNLSVISQRVGEWEVCSGMEKLDNYGVDSECVGTTEAEIEELRRYAIEDREIVDRKFEIG